MRVETPLFSKNQTGRAMYRLVECFYADLGPLASLSLGEWFDRVREIPYQKDIPGQETVARPSLLLSEFPALDCKKKGILIASWLRANGVPYRFVAVSQRSSGRFHHVFPQAFMAGQWRNLDATYPRFEPFAPKRGVTRAQELAR